MKVLVYSTDLSDREWRKLCRLLPPEKTGGRPRIHARRLICDAIFYLVRAGCAWHLLPCNFPPWKTVYDYFRRWCLAGVWRRLHSHLRRLCRRRQGRSAKPTAAIIDSQSAKASRWEPSAVLTLGHACEYSWGILEFPGRGPRG